MSALRDSIQTLGVLHATDIYTPVALLTQTLSSDLSLFLIGLLIVGCDPGSPEAATWLGVQESEPASDSRPSWWKRKLPAAQPFSNQSLCFFLWCSLFIRSDFQHSSGRAVLAARLKPLSS
jgi:hypothetical protein